MVAAGGLLLAADDLLPFYLLLVQFIIKNSFKV